MTQRVLFVSYGGGHARMIIPVLRTLLDSTNINCETLALAGGGPIFKSESVPYKGFKDFLTTGDEKALAWGKRLAEQSHHPESGIEHEESVAYLGLCYWDLILRHGEEKAAELWRTRGRQAFLPLTVMERFIAQIRPDMVVTTNSPRSEQAAIAIAKQHAIPTLSMVDLYGVAHTYPLNSDYITVLCEQVISNLQARGVTIPRSHCLITGNPAFDRAFDYRGPVDYDWRRATFPSIDDNSKALLWIDTPAYWNMHENKLFTRTNDDIVRDLNSLAHAAVTNECVLLVRPHPSQQRAIFDDWLQSAPPCVMYAGDMPLYPLLRGVDAVCTYDSTVGIESLLMHRRVIQLQYYPGQCDMPLAEQKMAWLARRPEDIPQRLHEAFTDEEEWQRMQKHIGTHLPQDKAAPKVAAHIERILALRAHH